MQRNIWRLAVAITLAGGCHRPAPMVPTYMPTPYSVSADVWAPDLSRIAGAHVEVVTGLYTGASCETNSDGRCTLPPAFSDAVTPKVRTTAAGFLPQTTFSFPSNVRRDGDVVALFFGLTPLAAPATIAGAYAVTVKPSEACAYPEQQTWTHTAVIKQNLDDPGWASVGILPDGNQTSCGFSGGVWETSLGFVADPDCEFGPITPPVTLVPPEKGGVLIRDGTARGRVEGATISVSLSGDLIVAGQTCRAADHLLTFVRR